MTWLYLWQSVNQMIYNKHRYVFGVKEQEEIFSIVNQRSMGVPTSSQKIQLRRIGWNSGDWHVDVLNADDLISEVEKQVIAA